MQWLLRFFPFARTNRTTVVLNRQPREIKNTREENHDHVAALIATHPELWESFKKLDAIHRKIKQREEGN